MRRTLLQPQQLVLLLQIGAFWPVWSWYLQRVSDGSDEPWGVFALVTVVLFLLLRATPRAPSNKCLLLASCVGLLYVATYSVLPPLVRALLALLSLAVVCSDSLLKRRFHLGLFGLLVLSLPIIASLQFYLGYPIRLVTAHLVAQALQAVGVSVSAQGTTLHWLGEMVSVDAPCSGVKMLWAGLYFNFTSASFLGLGAFQTWCAYILALTLVFSANAIRTFILFFSESGLLEAPQWFHVGVGLFLFCLVCLGVLCSQAWLRRRGE